MFCSCDEGDIFAISDEDGRLARGDKDGAVVAIVDVEIGGDIEDEEAAIRAAVDVVLLFLDGIDGLHLELPVFFEVSIVVGIVLLFYGFRLEDVCRKGGLRLC